MHCISYIFDPVVYYCACINRHSHVTSTLPVEAMVVAVVVDCTKMSVSVVYTKKLSQLKF